MSVSKEMYEAIVAIVEDRLREVRVTREGFDQLRGALLSLAEAQRRTEERLERLVEAQQALTARVDQLAEGLGSLTARVDQLAEAQRRTEARLEALAEAQRRTELALRDLAQAVGKLSDTVGYGLEDIARVVLPGYLQRHLGIRVEELDRRFVGPEGQEMEVDLYGEGEQDGQRVVVLGEAKSRIYAREVEQFDRAMQPVAAALKGKVVKLMMGYWIHPSASRVATERGILLVASYQR